MSYLLNTFETFIEVNDYVLVVNNDINASKFLQMEEAYDFWQFVYVTEGALIEYANGEPHLLRAGDIIFHEPGELTKTESVQEEKNAYAYFVSFACNSKAMELLKGYRTHLSQNAKSILDNVFSEAERTLVLKYDDGTVSMIPKGSAPIGGQQMYKIYMEAFLITLIREQIEQNPNKFFASKEDYYSAIHKGIAEFLKNKTYDVVTIEEICREFNCGRTFLHSLFKEYEGTSIMNYYNKLKIDEACRLITKTDSAFSTISELLCFNSPYYFSTVFKRIKGITPMEYKKLYKK